MYYSVYYIPFIVFSRKRDKKNKQLEKATKKNIAQLYTDRQEIISSLVRYMYVTAQAT